MILTHPVMPTLPEVRCEPVRALPAYIPSSTETREMYILWRNALTLAQSLLSCALAREDGALQRAASDAERIANDLSDRWMRMHDADKAQAMAEHFGGVS